MKLRFSNQRNHALTLVEVLVIIVVLAVITVVFFPWPEPTAKRKSALIACVNNLKEDGLCYFLWAGDNNDKFPFQVSTANGGTMELAATGNVVATFQIMSNELSTPRLLICPADTEHVCATNFKTDFSDKNISYCVGLNARKIFPQTFLSGDDNFEIAGASVKSGLLEFSTNTPISWTVARHKIIGNIGLADGSVQMANNSGITNLLHQTGITTNRLAIP